MPPIDQDSVAAFWQRFVDTLDETAVPTCSDVARFGDSSELADELMTLLLAGHKRATAGSLQEFQAEGSTVPRVGDLWVACDGRGRPRVVLRTTEVRVGPLSSVDDEFAWDEGEGDRTREDWLRGHTTYFKRTHQRLGIPFHADIPVVFERFEIVYQEPTW